MDNFFHRLSIFKKRKEVFRRKNYNLILVERKIEKRKSEILFGRKFLLQIIFLRLCDKEEKEKEAGGAVS